MKPILPVLLSAILFASCTQFHYVTVNSVNVPKNEKNEFVVENDSLRIIYQFTDHRGKVGISIFNKLSQPLEIDWKKSALILDEQAYAFYNPNLSFLGTAQRDSMVRDRRFSIFSDATYLASFNGSILIDEPNQFIPPSAKVFKVPLFLPVGHLKTLPEKKVEKVSAKTAGGVNLPYKRVAYDIAQSPVKFRSYLTFRLGSGAAVKEFAVEHQFYVSEIWKTASAPSSFPEKMLQRGDRFFL